MAVTIVGYDVKQTKEGRDFIILEAQGEPEMLQSSQTGRFYMGARKCGIPTSFENEAMAEAMVGKQLPGRIIRMEVEPFEITDKQTGEVILLAHRNVFLPEGADIPMPATVE